MTSKRRWLARILDGLLLLGALKDRLGDRLVVLNFHRLAPRRGDAGAFSDPEEDASSFETQVIWLKHHVRVLGEDELAAAVQSGRHPAGLSAIITMDDGYADAYTIAYPILKYHHVPAICFVTTGAVEKREVFWWDHVAHALKATKCPSFRFQGRDYAARDPSTYTLLCRKMKWDPQPCRQKAIAELRRELDVPRADTAAEDREILSWNQLREMRDLVAIGSHTCNHPLMSSRPLVEQRDELVRSKAILEAHIERPVRSIAYPWGGRAHFTEDTKRIAREAGYALGFSYYSGGNAWRTMDRFDIRRLTPAGSDALSMSSAAILPGLLTYTTAEDA